MKRIGKLFALSAAAICSLGTMTSCHKTGFKVGLLCLHGQTSTYDNNFIEAFEKVCREKYHLVEGVGYEIRTDVAEDYNQIYTAAKEWAEDGYSMVFADSFGHQYGFEAVAREYPKTEFCHATGTTAVLSKLPNYHNAFAKIYEGRYLAGVAAGQKMYEDIKANKYTVDQANIGYVGAWPYAEVVSGYTSFYLGACSIFDKYASDPLINNKRPKMYVKYTYSWYDYGAEKEAAFTLIRQYKCKLISQHADSMGAPQACASENIPNVCYNISTKAKTPKTYLFGSKIDWAPYFDLIIGEAKKKFEGGTADIDFDYIGKLDPDHPDESSVKTLEFGSIASQDVKNAVESAENDLKGGMHVFDCNKFTITKDATHNPFAEVTLDAERHVTSYIANVIDDENYTPDTEVVRTDAEGTYIAESEYDPDVDSNDEGLPSLRSAPFFELIIDGIETLN